MALDQHDIRSVTHSEFDEDDILGVQCDPYGNGKEGCPAIELHHNYGFQAMPLDPDADGACQVHTAYEGSRQHAWLSFDARVIAKLPPIKKGESRMYGAAGQFIRCHLDGSISTYTTDDATPTGKSVFTQVAPDGFHQFAPWGTSRFDKSGFHVRTHTGARLDMGGIGGIPGPLSAIGSYFSVQAAMMTVQCTAATFGTGAVPLARTLELSTLLTQMNAVMVAAGACIAAISGTPGESAVQLLKPALATALHALELAIAGELLKMQSIVSGA